MTTLLIVDDDENNRLVLSDCLEGDGYTILEAVDGEEALKVAAESTPDLILLDVQMPVMDGHEALRHLKSQDATREIPVIMVTALDMDSQIAMFLNDGAVDHIAKPFSTMVVRARVRAALRHKIPPRTSSGPSGEQGKVFSFIGAKGGVGTTTVALNVATVLASQQQRVIAAEFRPYFGTFVEQLNMIPTDNLASLVSQESGSIDAEQVEKFFVKHKSGIEVLLGPQISEGYCEITPDHANSLVEILRSKADYVIIDLPSHPTEAVQTVLRQSDFVGLVLEREPQSFRAARVMLELLQSRGVGGGGIGAIVVTRAAMSSPIQAIDLQKNLPCRLIGVIPPDPDACVEATKSGVPVVVAHPKSICAGSLSELAGKIIEEYIPALTF